MGFFAEAGVAIDGSKFKARQEFHRAKMQRRTGQIEESVARYLHQLDSADRQEPSLAYDEVHSPQREDCKAERGNAAG